MFWVVTKRVPSLKKECERDSKTSQSEKCSAWNGSQIMYSNHGSFPCMRQHLQIATSSQKWKFHKLLLLYLKIRIETNERVQNQRYTLPLSKQYKVMHLRITGSLNMLNNMLFICVAITVNCHYYIVIEALINTGKPCPSPK